MYCVKCHFDVVDCTCDDIDQRLQEFANEPTGIVSYLAKQDIEARKIKVLYRPDLLKEEVVER